MNGIGSSSRIRIGGINSGLDTEKLVSDMLAVSQTRVDRQYQSRQSLIWKRDAYRTTITGINALKNKWFSPSNPSTYLGNAGFFSTYKAETESKLFSVNATANAKNSGFTLDSIKQLATNNTIKGQANISADLKGIMVGDDAKFAEVFDTANAAGKKGVDFDIVLDGVKKTINVQGATRDDVARNLQSALDTAFGTNASGASRVKATYDNTTDPANPSISISAGNSKVMIGSTSSAGLTALGFTNGQSSNVRLGDRLSDVTFTTPLIGGKFNFTINDVQFSFDGSNTINQVISAVNNSKAGVTMTYDEVNDTFSIASKISGSGTNVRITQESGNLLSSMLGAKEGNGVGTIGSLYGDLASGSVFDKAALNTAKNQGFDITINGETKTVYIPGVDASGVDIDYSALTDEEAMKLIQNQINAAFQDGELVKLTKDSSNKLSFEVRDQGTITLAPNSLTGDRIALTALGFGPSDKLTNIVPETGLMGDLSIPAGNIVINGQTFAIDPSETITDFVDRINTAIGAGSVIYKDGAFTFNNVDSITGNSDVMQKMFGVDSYTPSTSTDNFSDVSIGKNAVVTINGVEIERSSNSFIYDGIEITLKGVSEFNPDGTVKEPAGKINIVSNVDDAVTKIKDFIKEYNTLIDLLTLQSTTKPNADYAPLTDAQKKSMTEQQIKDWDKVAKQGVLYNDPEINKLLGGMRTALYSTGSTGMALYEMGITTGDYKNGGKLEFSAADSTGISGEDKLRKVLTDRPDAVANLFADPVNGITAKINNVLDSAVSTLPSKKGSLISIAGMEKHSSEKNNTIEESIKDIDELIIKYKRQLADEEERYWAQFTAMEKAMATLNNQSSALLQQLGGGA